jgi:uncharacterized protein with beta-barrel porin domain
MQKKCAQWLRANMLCSAAAVAICAATSNVAFAAVTPDGVTPAQVVDTANTQPWWVGLGIRNEAGNGGSSCTGLLINPRTVIFAAHCVDGVNPDAYNAPTALGDRAQVGYTTDPTFGRTNLREFILGLDFVVPAGDARTMTASSVMVWYDPRSRFGSAAIPGNGTFLPADVALAGFDTPNELLGRDAVNGMALLFSPVSGSVPVVMGGYGVSGNGFTGTRTSSTSEESFFRRLVNNTVGFLGDERTISLGIYPAATADLLDPPGLVYQDLYWADFDNPNRATQPFFNGPGADPVCPGTNPNCRLDHDPFPGNAVAGEGITAAGDSGSPLATNAFGRTVSLGVLSQGSRFFYESIGNPNDNFVRFTEFSNYGTAAGYNPLFLFWDQIVVNNPYKYVTTVAGNGEWTDATRWVQELDPLYMILSGGTLVNGLPGTPALGVSGANPNFGTITPNPSPAATCAFTGTCPLTGGTSAPVLGSTDLMTPISIGDDGTQPTPLSPIDSTIAGNAGSAAANDYEDTIPGNPHEQTMTTALWSSGTLIPVNTGTLTGPGTTNFVPDNTNGTPGLQNSTRFFEVNLRAAGTTFLTGATVTIDRLSVRGASSGLNIRAGARLNTTISSYVDDGTLTVNGIFDPTNLFVLGGRVMGAGTINANMFNVGGVFAPGNSIDTMTVIGSYVQGPAALLEIEVTDGSSDVVAVTGNALLGGTVRFQPLGPNPLVGQFYDFVTTTGTVSGAFASVQDFLPGTLFPIVSYGPSFARVTIGDLCSFADGPVDTPICLALSDPGVQGDPDMIPAIAGIQSLASSPDALSAAMKALNPTRAHGQSIVGLATGDLLRSQFGRRTHDLLSDSGDSVLAQRDLARTQLASVAPTADMLASSAEAALNAIDGTGGGGGRSVDLPNGFAMFFAADVALTETEQPGGIGQDEADVAALTAGIDSSNGNGQVFGLALSYLQSNVSQDYGLGGGMSGDGVAASAYGNFSSGLLYLDGYLSYGWHSFDTERTLATSPATTALAVGSTDATQFLAGATLGYHLVKHDRLTMGAVGGFYYNGLEIDGYTEIGAGPLSAILPDRSVDSLRAQLGGEAALHLSRGLTPILRVVWNHEFMDDALVTQAAFAGAPAVTFTTPGPTLGTDWVTVGAGVSGRVSEGTSFTFRYQHDFGRDGQDNQQVSAAARMAF